MSAIEFPKDWATYMKEISQDLVLLIFVGGIASFFLFVIISSKRKKDKDPDKKNIQ